MRIALLPLIVTAVALAGCNRKQEELVITPPPPEPTPSAVVEEKPAAPPEPEPEPAPVPPPAPDPQSAAQALDLQPPRKITKEDKKAFIKLAEKAPKRPFRVISTSKSEEAMALAKQLRELLDAAGFLDPTHPNIDTIEGANITVPNGEVIAICYPRQERGKAKEVQDALTKIVGPTASVLAPDSFAMKSGTIAVAVLEETP